MQKQLLAAGDVTMFQQITLVGRVGSFDALKVVKSGDRESNVCHVSIAVDRPGQEDGEKPLWMRATLWNGLAKGVHQYLQVGSIVTVSGELSYSSETGGPRLYEDKEGFAAASFEMTVDRFRFIARAPEKNGESATEPKDKPKMRPATPKAEVETEPAAPAVAGNGIPF